jgi:hypothetical protein
MKRCKPPGLGSPEDIAFVRSVIAQLTPAEAEKFKNNSYFAAVFESAAVEQGLPPHATFNFIAVERQLAEEAGARRATREAREDLTAYAKAYGDVP